MLLEFFVIAFASSFTLSRHRTRAVIARLSTVLAVSLALVACDRQSPPEEQVVDVSIAGLSGKLDISQRGEAMPPDRFFKPDGNPVSLSDFKGKPVLINLWATWCAPCVVELPTLEALSKREDERLQVIVVSEDTTKAPEVAAFLAERGFERLAPYVDPENNLSFAFATGVIPTTILYDANGKEVWRVIGGTDWNGSRIAAMMEDTLQRR